MYPRDETKAGVVRSQGRRWVVGRLGQRSAGLGPRERRGPCQGDRQGQHHRLSSWDHVGDPQETLMTRRCLGPRAALVCQLPPDKAAGR